ncbi:LysE family translocator, partial [Halobacillus sp. BBL2006]|uniref:LysE family translocator n=1 Tax=Halobacillus sp. BBL2006 TaxID=1543706 RepID=UPI000541A3FD
APVEIENRTKRSHHSLYKKGIIMNVLNPKVSLFFLALLPQFVNNSLGSVSLQMLGLGAVFLIQAFIIFSLVSVFSEKIRHVLANNEWVMKRMNLFEGMILTAIGLNVAVSGK